MIDHLYVVTAVSNTERYKSRYKLYRDFEKYCLDSGAKLYTVEAAFGERPHEITTSDNPNHIQLRTHSQIWHKENLLNIGISRLPEDAKYIAWIDADVAFARPTWVSETIHQLQHFDVVQMFSHVTELSPDYTPAPAFYNLLPASWMYCYNSGESYTGKADYNTNSADGNKQRHYWHPGFAWAARREALNHLGGLMDYHIVGSADFLMAIAMTGVRTFPDWNTGTADRWTKEWTNRCNKYIKGNVGHVTGLLLHHWHGRKIQRNYSGRREILTSNQFDPELDLKRDCQGLWQLTDRTPKLRDDLRNYFRSRNEDSIDLI